MTIPLRSKLNILAGFSHFLPKIVYKQGLKINNATHFVLFFHNLKLLVTIFLVYKVECQCDKDILEKELTFAY